MDAVELAIPAAVAVSKLMGGGTGGGGGGVTVMEVEAAESDHISIVVAPSIDRCSSFLSPKDELGALNTSESTLWNEMPGELCGRVNQQSSFHRKDASEELKFGSRNSSPLSVPSLEGKQVQRRAGTVGRNGSGCSKRSRVGQIEGRSVNESEANDVKEKNQTGKQKNGLSGKRSERRNCRVTKSKYDYFPLKAGMMSFNSAAGGNSFLDTYDVTKHLDELSLNELLDGNYKGPTFAKEKKRAATSNDNILQSVNKACSILRLRKPQQTQYSAEIDIISSCPVNSDACVTSKNGGDKGNICSTDLSSYDKVQDFCSNPQTPSKVLDFPLCQPKEILACLALPPPKDLDSMLLDVAKPAVSSKSSLESRGKQAPHRISLPPFSWSHNSAAHCKTSADAIKSSATKITCQGRWVKVGNTGTSLDSGFLADLESLAYDNSLVPLVGPKCDPSGDEIAPCISVTFPRFEFEFGSSSSAKCSIPSQLPLECHSSPKREEDEHSPRLLAAARTLCQFAAHPLKQEPHGMLKWPKGPSEKTMKACKSKSKDKSGDVFVSPKSAILSYNQVKNANETLPLKKPKLLVNEKSTVLRKGPLNWSMPRSSRPSPSRSFRDSFADTNRYSANAVKQSCMMPPPRALDKACKSQQKLRKSEPMDWNREGAQLD